MTKTGGHTGHDGKFRPKTRIETTVTVEVSKKREQYFSFVFLFANGFVSVAPPPKKSLSDLP